MKSTLKKTGALGLAFAAAEMVGLRHFEITEYRCRKKKVKEPFRAAVVADLHEASFGPKNARLLETLRRQMPDVIFIPGDFISAHKERYYQKNGFPKETLYTLLAMAKLCPVYFSPGNHESSLGAKGGMQGKTYEWFRKGAEKAGVHFLCNEKETLYIGKNVLEITGLEISSSFYTRTPGIRMRKEYLLKTAPHFENPDAIHILLAHHPAFFETYCALSPDLVLSGHNHGGIVRIPGIGSVFSPQFDLFPKYDAGRFDREGCTMIVSRGLGTHTIPIRVNNPPELVLVHMEPPQGSGIER